MNQVALTYSKFQASYTSISAKSGHGRFADLPATPAASNGEAAPSGDLVSFSAVAMQMRQESLVVQGSLTGAERGIGDDQISSALAGAYDAMSLFEEAGRSEYLESIANPTDLSSEATAGRILGGITGYIFDAFRLNNPDATQEEFDAFFAQVQEGFEQGFGEALEIIEAAGALTEQVDADVHETADIVREGLAEFYEAARGQFGAGGAPAGVEALIA